MTSSVPDSFNLDDLSAMLENAPQEEDLHTAAANDDKQEYTPEYIEKVAQETLELATEKCKDPLVHKVIMMAVCSRMIDWHTQVAMAQFEEGNEKSGICWMRDAGKFQAMMDSLVNIGVGPDDFTLVE
jgi:hypothetical protein